jgi:hypothetical protein
MDDGRLFSYEIEWRYAPKYRSLVELAALSMRIG